MDINDINDIIRRCLKKDTTAEKQLHTMYAKRIHGICRMYTKDSEQAKDCAQEIFIKIFANLDTYDLTRASFNAWVIKITHNTNRSILKKKGLKVEALDPVLLALISDSDMQEEVNENRQTSYRQKITYSDVLAAIGQLPSGYFEVANLALIEQRKHKEIAKSLDIKESSSRAKLTRAKRMLRSILKKPFM